MTIEERFDRIEHFTASLAEDRRKDREEYKSLWRDTQRRMDEFAAGMVELRHNLNLLTVETRLKFEETDDRLRQYAAESRAEGKALNERIAALVSAMGAYIVKDKA